MGNDGNKWPGCRNCKHVYRGGGKNRNLFCDLKSGAGDGFTATTRREEAARKNGCNFFATKDPIADLNNLPGNVEPMTATDSKPTLTGIEPLDIDPLKTPIWEIDPDFINPYKELPPIQTWSKMGKRPALPKEGIVTFSAKQKRGKSLSTYALAIPLLSGNPFDALTPIDRPNLVMVFDMEMSETTLTNRVLRQVQTIGEQGNRFIVCPLKAKNIADRISAIAAKVDLYRPDIVVIDQAAKLVEDINATAETNMITDLLDKMSIGRAVWVVMHENKSEQDTNMRGHLGSYLSFAAVEAYSVDRKEGVFTITPKEARDTDTDDAACVQFALDESGNIISAIDIVEAKTAEEKASWRNNFTRIFGKDEKLSYTELKKRINNRDQLSESAAEAKINKARELGVIVKAGSSPRDPYILTPE